MDENILKATIKKIIIGLLIITCGITSYAIEIDTFNILQYKIKNHQLKKCLSDIAEEESGKLYQQVGLVVVDFSQGEKEYLMVGCYTLSWLQFYSLLYEVKDNDFVGCSYLNNSICFLFGNEMKQYLSDTIGMVSLVDRNSFFKPLLGSEADFQEWKEHFFQGELLVDPPVWIFKKQKRKFILIDNNDYYYFSTAPHIRSQKTNK